MGDLISKSALIEDLRKDRESVCSHVFCHTDSEHEEVLAIDLEQMINNQPTVDAVPVVHGSWIKGFLGEWQCSECREENCYAYDENLKRFTDLYCPNCGAKMDGKKVQE